MTGLSDRERSRCREFTPRRSVARTDTRNRHQRDRTPWPTARHMRAISAGERPARTLVRHLV